MKPRFHQLFPTALVLISSITVNFSSAGIMDQEVPVQTYRDFAENRGIFAPDATHVPVTNNHGDPVGEIERMMSFDSVIDAGWASLTGDPSFLATVSHNNATDVSFTTRFGANNTSPAADSYHIIQYNRAWGSNTNYDFDYAAPRLNKIVTEADAVPYLTDSTYLDHMIGQHVLRVGGGTQTVATGENQETTIQGAYTFLTGGTITFTNEIIRIPYINQAPSNHDGYSYKLQAFDPVSPASAFNSYSFTYNFKAADASEPLDIGVRGGDSGSSSWFFNPTAQEWQYVGTAQSTGGSGYSSFAQMRSGNAWAVSTIESSYAPSITPSSDANQLTWNAPNSNGSGSISATNTSWSYTGLPSQTRGATTSNAFGTAANDAQMLATQNLTFAGSGGTLSLTAPIEMGAGSLTFQADYTLTNSGNTSATLNSAGFIVHENHTLTTELTARTPNNNSTLDEWRKTGAGTMVISGSGDTLANLNVGGTGVTVLNRSQGYAANNLKINGGATTVQLAAANQIKGNLIFGHRGGILDLHGIDTSRNQLYALDNGARITTHRANATFTYTDSSPAKYLGAFIDDGTDHLNVTYQPETPSSASWALSGKSHISGNLAVNAGSITLTGTPTLHAGGFIDPSDWQTAEFSAAAITILPQATLTLSHHATLSSTTPIEVNANASLHLEGDSTTTLNAEVHLSAPDSSLVAEIPADQSFTIHQPISGSGSIIKSAKGTLTLSGNQPFSSASNTINDGLVIADSTAALGDHSLWTIAKGGALSAPNTSIEDVLTFITPTSAGTLALDQTSSSQILSLPSFHTHPNLFLGAVNTVEVGTPLTTETLAPWTLNQGWHLGGGGGSLVMNLKLSGSNPLVIGDGSSTGEVVLTNPHNSDFEGGDPFTGEIILSGGVSLRATTPEAFGIRDTSHPFIQVGYTSSIDLGADTDTILHLVKPSSNGVLSLPDGATVTSPLNFTSPNLPSLSLGTSGTATFSGTITPGPLGYHFGGGNLTVTTDLTGNTPLILDAHNHANSAITLSGHNTLTGPVIIRGYDVNELTADTAPTGTLTVHLQSDNALGSPTITEIDRVSTLALHEHSATAGVLIGAGHIDLGTGHLTIGGDNPAPVTYNGIISGKGSLTITGPGTQILANKNTFEGDLTIANGATAVATIGTDYTAKQAGSFGSGNIYVTGGSTLTATNTFAISGGQNTTRTISLNESTLLLQHGSSSGEYFRTLHMTGSAIIANGPNKFIRVAANGLDLTSYHDAAASHINTGVDLTLGDLRAHVEDGAASNDFSITGNITENTGAGSGARSIIKTGNGTLTLAGTLTYTGNTDVQSGTLHLAPTSKIKFNPSANRTSNRILGTGNATLDGTLEIDFSRADATAGNEWQLVKTNTTTYGNTFSVAGFSNPNHNGIWTLNSNGKTWAFNQANGTLSVYNTPAPDSYEAWFAQQSFLTRSSSRLSDPDTDGITNLQEFLFGTNPLSSDPSLTQTEQTPDALVLHWKQKTSGATYHLLQTTDLNSPWTEAPEPIIVDEDLANGYQTVHATIPINQAHAFFRIEATEAP